MKRKLLTFTGVAILLAASSLGAQTVLTASSWIFPTHALSMAQKDWCDQLDKNTSGKMKCNILPRGVTAGPGTYDAIKNGQADISFTDKIDERKPAVLVFFRDGDDESQIALYEFL